LFNIHNRANLLFLSDHTPFLKLTGYHFISLMMKTPTLSSRAPLGVAIHKFTDIEPHCLDVSIACSELPIWSLKLHPPND